MARKQSEILAEELEALRAEIKVITDNDDATEDEITRAETLGEEWDVKKAAFDKAVAREEKVDGIMRARLNPSNTEKGSYLEKGPEVMRRVEPFQFDGGETIDRISRSQLIGRARKAVEAVGDHILSDANTKRLDRMVDIHTTDFDGEYIAKRVLYTENEAYRSAFMKKALYGAEAAFTQDELHAVSEFREFELRRAMSEGTNSAGGFGVPVFIDPTIILTSGAADAPVVRIARVETITNQVWKGVSSAGMTWSWDQEATAVSDDSPTLAQPSVTAYMARGFIPYSIEVGMDYPGFAANMARLIDQGYTDLLAVATTTGSGSNQPRGIFTALDANTNVEVVTTTDGSFGAVDVFKVWNSLPERYRSRATWVMSVSVESAIRQFGTNANSSAYFTVDLTREGLTLLNGRPVVVTDYAPGFSGGVPGTTGAANILAVGDFSNYLIAQRAGMSIEQIPHLFDVTNNRPTGQRGWFAWARAGADSVNDLGFRLLQNQ